MRRLAAALFLALALVSPAAAVAPGDALADPALEARARELGRELRCLVCQNQSIDDSDAPLAQDLRRLVRERLAAGDTDDQVVAYLVARYGDFVRLRPPFRPETWALWLGPAAILGVGGFGAALWLRRRAVSAEAPPLTPDEERELAQLLEREP